MLIRAVWPWLLVCFLACAGLMQVQWGYGLYALVPILMVTLIGSAIRTHKQSQNLPALAIKMLLCLTTISTIAMMHARYHQQSRLHANIAVEHINQYHHRHGHYPPVLQDAFENVSDINRTWQYQHNSSQTQLKYPSTFMHQTWFVYDFEQQTWQKHSHLFGE